MEIEGHAVLGSMDLRAAQPRRGHLLLVNVGLYFGVVLSEAVFIAAPATRYFGAFAILFGFFLAVLSVPGLLVFAFGLGFLPPAWPWWRKRLLALAGSVYLVGGWLFVADALTMGLVPIVWPFVLFGLVGFGFVCRTPRPNKHKLG